jgi:hypothetical protein
MRWKRCNDTDTRSAEESSHRVVDLTRREPELRSQHSLWPARHIQPRQTSRTIAKPKHYQPRHDLQRFACAIEVGRLTRGLSGVADQRLAEARRELISFGMTASDSNLDAVVSCCVLPICSTARIY